MSLEVEDVAVAFGAIRAVDGVSLRLEAGCHAVIGPNGAGKTTLMQIVSGLVRPDRGRVGLDGHDLTAASAPARARAGIGRSFQRASVVPALSARENAALAAQARAGSSFRFWRAAARERTLNDAADAALVEVGLANRAEVAAGALAHGERRLVELAMVLAARPRVMVLDEPMAGLGTAESAALIHLLARLKGSVPILLIEHDMAAVFRLADRLSLMVDGRIASAGTPADVRADPVARAAYLGEAA